MKKNSRPAFLLTLVFFVILTQITLTDAAFAETGQNPGYFDSVRDMIKENYNGQVDEKSLDQDSLDEMFNTMDPYTTYFTNDEAKSFLSTMDGSFEGIGVTLEKVKDYIVIIKVFSNSPAEKAGLLPGDLIISADGSNLVGVSTDEAVSRIKGPTGTKVILGIKRDTAEDELKITVTRGVISLDPVSYEVRDGIGYIKLEIFNANAYNGISKALEEIDRQGITRIILDLRENPGGEVTQATAIAKKFVPKGVITKLDFKSEKQNDEVYYSKLKKTKYKLAILVDGNTASASEILSGAVQDTKAGTLIGTKTFGKAKVQSVFPILTPEAYEKYSKETGAKIVNAYELYDYGIFPDESEFEGWVKMTTGYYYTPSGRMIDGVGLTPDFIVEDLRYANGIDVNGIAKLKKTGKPTLNSNGNDVYNAEKILKAMGYSIGSPDTILDAKTFSAIRNFQRSAGLYPYGVLDYATQNALNRELGYLLYSYDKQYAKAIEVLTKQ